MYSLQSNPSPLSLLSSADNGCTADIEMVIMWTVPTAVWSVSYWVSQWKKYPPVTILPNISKYCPVTQCQYRSNPICSDDQLSVALIVDSHVSCCQPGWLWQVLHSVTFNSAFTDALDFWVTRFSFFTVEFRCDRSTVARHGIVIVTCHIICANLGQDDKQLSHFHGCLLYTSPSPRD